MNNGIIFGADLGFYRTIGIGLGISKNENRDGVKSRYMVFTIVNGKSMMAKPTKVIKFDDELPGLFDILNTFAKDDPQRQGSKIVDLTAFKQSEYANDYQQVLKLDGGMIMQYKLRKGTCYGNDVDGKRILNNNNEPVTRDTIKVFVMVDKMIPNESGGMTTTFVDGFDLDGQGQRLESRFWKVAVEQEPQSSQPEEQTAATAPSF